MFANLERLRRLMIEKNLDAIIATSPENVTYLSGYYCGSQWRNKGTQAYAVIARDDTVQPFLVMPNLEVDAWAEQPSWITDIRPYGTFYRDFSESQELRYPDDLLIYEMTHGEPFGANAIETLVATLRDKTLDAAKLGLDETGLAPSMWRTLVDALPRAEIVEASGIWRATRMVKTAQEIELLGRAARLNEIALTLAMEQAHAGVTERELISVYNTEVARRGGVPAFWTTNAGRRTGHIHTLDSDYTLADGDLVKWDVGFTLENYWTDTGRTRAIGSATAAQQQVYGALLKGQQAAIQKFRPGVAAAEIFETAVETTRAAGLPAYQRTHCGHGIGISLYDPPLIQARASTTVLASLGQTDFNLEADMVFCIELPYYRLGQWGMIIEDTIVVRENGPEYLTRMQREL